MYTYDTSELKELMDDGLTVIITKVLETANYSTFSPEAKDSFAKGLDLALQLCYVTTEKDVALASIACALATVNKDISLET
jgi:hypothetical protein